MTRRSVTAPRNPLGQAVLVLTALLIAAATPATWPNSTVAVLVGTAFAIGPLGMTARSLRRAARRIDRIIDEELAPSPTEDQHDAPRLPTGRAPRRDRARVA